jgi:hypothetical protein
VLYPKYKNKEEAEMAKRHLKIGLVLLFGLFFIFSSTYAEINLSAPKGKLGIKAQGKTTTLDKDATTATVTDTTGGSLDVKYEPTEEIVNLTASSGNSSVTYNIAKIFLAAGQSVEVGPTGPMGSFYIANTSSGDAKVTVTFPDGSKIVMPANSEVSLTYLADGSYHLKVMEGTVEYTDAKGNTKMLDSKSPVVLVQGFGQVPGWRIDEPKRNPATP